MKNLKEYIKEGLFDDIDNIENTNGLDNATKGFEQLDKEKIIDWIKENYECTGLKILKKSNKDGLYEVSALDVKVKNKNITSLTNGMFEWKKVNNSFSCNKCNNLKSLEGAPKKVGGSFSCSFCPSLTSLEYAPNEVEGNFNCSYCPSLTSLEYAPNEVGRNFYCNHCETLKSLKGAPKKVERDFSCIECTSLTSLEGAPKEVGGNFYCIDCKTEFTKEDVKKASNVKNIIVC